MIFPFKIEYEGYLTQSKLLGILKQIPEITFLGEEVKVSPKSRRRWDMLFKKGEQVLAIEFDGDSHYQNSLVSKSDKEKNKEAESQGITVVRVPFFIQLDSDVFEILFGFRPSVEILNNFPSGFITTKTFPCSFGDIGISRLFHEVKDMPEKTKKEVVQSLIDRSLVYGEEYVWPPSFKRTAIGIIEEFGGEEKDYSLKEDLDIFFNVLQ
jgi:hypothetical protein